ncbi:MAG: cupin domain-containing protein [Cyclobacteriaceae bacterium]
MTKYFVFLAFTLMSVIVMAQSSAGFNLEELYAQAKEQDGNYLKFIDNDQLTSGIYQLEKGAVDKQRPHEWDEIYYVLEGKATLNVENESYDAVPGAILFVKAKVDHTFVAIEENLKVLVFFSKK